MKEVKPIGVKNYGSICHLPESKLGPSDKHLNDGQTRILTIKKRDRHDKIFVFEKYDGSNVGVAKIDGKIIPLTRSGYHAKTSPYRQHHIFKDWVDSNIILFQDLLFNGERIAGEWMHQAHGMRYDVIGDPIIFFDYFDDKNERETMYYLLEKLRIYGLPQPRQIHEGDSIKVDDLIEELNKKTQYCKSEFAPEGMVYRVERKEKFDFAGKWVRSDYPTGQYLDDEVLNKLQ